MTQTECTKTLPQISWKGDDQKKVRKWTQSDSLYCKCIAKLIYNCRTRWSRTLTNFFRLWCQKKDTIGHLLLFEPGQKKWEANTSFLEQLNMFGIQPGLLINLWLLVLNHDWIFCYLSYMLTMVGVRSDQVSESVSMWKWGLKTSEFSAEVPIFKVIFNQLYVDHSWG